LGVPKPLPGPHTDAERVFPCLWCDGGYTTHEGLNGHLTRQHNAPAPFKAVDVWGDVCPICGFSGEGKSVGNHIGQSHKYADYRMTVPRAFVWARDNGDPHGAYAALIQRVAAFSK
jgi:hypothetical protein